MTGDGAVVLTHGMNCSYHDPEIGCTCCLAERIALSTEQTMHRAWRKRAEEAEATIRQQAAEIERLTREVRATEAIVRAEVAVRVKTEEQRVASEARTADLLKALERIVGAAQAWDRNLSNYCDGPERDELRAAIAAAKGETV